jgi:hypothetical protein
MSILANEDEYWILSIMIFYLFEFNNLIKSLFLLYKYFETSQVKKKTFLKYLRNLSANNVSTAHLITTRGHE